LGTGGNFQEGAREAARLEKTGVPGDIGGGVIKMSEIQCFTGGMAATNGYLFGAPEGMILVDAPEGVADWLAEHEVAIGALMLTHGHYDHVLDAARVKREHDCRVYCFEDITPELTLETLLQAMGMGEAVERVEADEYLSGVDEVTVLGQAFKVLHVPGHSPDSICFLRAPGAGEDEEETESGKRELLFGGDVLFQGSIGRTDFPHGDHDALISGIKEKVFVLGDGVVVLPGHGPATTVGEERATNPFVGEGAG
jgi:hydroxyacylglutathione hydrolase